MAIRESYVIMFPRPRPRPRPQRPRVPPPVCAGLRCIRLLIEDLRAEWRALDERIEAFDGEFVRMARVVWMGHPQAARVAWWPDAARRTDRRPAPVPPLPSPLRQQATRAAWGAPSILCRHSTAQGHIEAGLVYDYIECRYCRRFLRWAAACASCADNVLTPEITNERFSRKTARSSPAGARSGTHARNARQCFCGRARCDDALCRARNTHSDRNRDSGEFCLGAASSAAAALGFGSGALRLDRRPCGAGHCIFR
jgi:hypothetical protein